MTRNDGFKCWRSWVANGWCPDCDERTLTSLPTGEMAIGVPGKMCYCPVCNVAWSFNETAVCRTTPMPIHNLAVAA